MTNVDAVCTGQDPYQGNHKGLVVLHPDARTVSVSQFGFGFIERVRCPHCQLTVEIPINSKEGVQVHN